MSFKINRGLFKLDLTDHHAVLGIPIDADTKVARKQYLKIARSLHPDTVKAKSEAEKKQASELLSKLVNPAYEQLSKTSAQAEYQLVLAQTGKRLAGEAEKPKVDSDAAKQLAAAGANIESVYKTAVKQLASSQYKNLAQVLEAIGQLSELNMVYLAQKQGQGVRTARSSAGKTATSTSPPPKVPGKAANQQTASATVPPPTPTSRIEPYTRRAQEYMNKGNFAKAVLELRDAIKLEPNNSNCHSLLGLAYLKQSQVSMARVHINKALQSDPKDPLALKGKQALDRLAGKTGGQKSSASSAQKKTAKSKGGMFGGLFGGKKK